MDIVYCPGEDMLCDFLTKVMVGAEFERQVVRAMYHSDVEEFKLQAAKAYARVKNASSNNT